MEKKIILALGVIAVLIIISVLTYDYQKNQSALTELTYEQAYARYFNDPLYCETDSDCKKLETMCCFDPINKYNWKPTICPNGECVSCDMVCPKEEPMCIDNQCILKRQ